MDEAITHYCHNDACSMKGVEQLRWWNHRDTSTGEYKAVWTSSGNCKECGKRMYEEGREPPPPPPPPPPVDPETAQVQALWSKARDMVSDAYGQDGTHLNSHEYEREVFRMVMKLKREEYA